MGRAGLFRGGRGEGPRPGVDVREAAEAGAWWAILALAERAEARAAAYRRSPGELAQSAAADAEREAAGWRGRLP